MSSLAKTLINKTLEELDKLITDSVQRQLLTDLRLLLDDDIEAVFSLLKERLKVVSLERDKLKNSSTEVNIPTWTEGKTTYVTTEDCSTEPPLFENIN